MKPQPVNPKPGALYSPAVIADNFVFVSGSVARDPETGEVPAGIRAQTEQTWENLKAVLNPLSSSPI